MIQLQALNYIISRNDLNFLDQFDEKYYFNYKNEYKFIKDHAQKYKRVPDIATVIDKFDDFTSIDVTESLEYITNKLYEDYVYNEVVSIVNNSVNDFRENAIKAKEQLMNKLNAIMPPVRNYGTDIVRQSKQRYDQLISRMSNPEAHTFSTGLSELDILFNGGLRRGEELIAIYARTNNAKTWIAQKISTAVWSQGYNVGFFEPEMSAIQVGYRFDTLYKNFDNYAITGYREDFDIDTYKKYINTLSNDTSRPLFNVTAPADFPDKRVTVSELRRWVIAKELKLLVIDGIGYLTNERNNGRKNTTENLTEISEDLMTLSIELSIPIIIVMQANRMGARDSEGEVNTEAPELDTIRGSDGIAFSASRAISIYKAKDIIKLYISKNRYGEKGQHLFYQYDINFGKFTYAPNPKDGLAIDTSDPNMPGASGDNSSNTSGNTGNINTGEPATSPDDIYNDSDDMF